jgi:YD repeat-containing protein
MASRSARAIVALSLFLPALLSSIAAMPVLADDCMEFGGKKYCGTPRETPWTVTACDEMGANLYSVASWCSASGGTNANGGCPGATPMTEDNLVSISTAFSEIMQQGGCSIQSDTGWHASFTSNFCWPGGDNYGGGFGILTSTFRRLQFVCEHGGMLISARKDRNIVCPVGFSPDTNPITGQTTCSRPLECCTDKVGNPITAGSGVKTETEVDYRHSSGLDFTRYYHSFQFYEPVSQTPGVHTEGRLGQVWRTGFDKRVVVLSPPSTFVSTAIAPPNGEIQYFDSNGREVLNYKGAGGTLVTVAGTGYFYKGPDRTEFYGTDGRLKSISLASGQLITLTYSDGTTGPNGGLVLDATGAPRSPAMPVPLNALIRVSDTQGNTLSLGYDTGDRIVLMTDPAGGQYHYAYDGSSNLTSVTYPDGRVRSYRYNEAANVNGASIGYALTSVIDENGDLYASFKYDANGNAVSTEHAGGTQRYTLAFGAGSTTITDALATPRTYAFQVVNGVTRMTSNSQAGGSGYGVGIKTQGYDAAGNRVSKTDFNNNQTCYAYDTTRNLETARVEGLASTASCSTVTAPGAALPAGSRKITTEWDPRWRVPARIAEPRRITGNTYNGNNASCAPASAVILEGSGTQPIAVLCSRTIQSTTDADGSLGFGATLEGQPRTWTYTYDADGHVLTANGPRTDVADVTTTAYYADDAADPGKRGNVSSITNALGHVTLITAYSPYGKPLTIVDPNGLTTSLAYDARQRLVSRSVGGEMTSYAYDGVGQMTQVTLPDGSALNYSYDAAHRLTGMSDSLGNRIAYALDAMGNRTQEQVFDPTNTLARTRSRVFDNLNRLSQEVGAQSQTTQYAYDTQGNVTSVTDPLNHATTNQYDALNRLIKVTDPSNGFTQYAYNGIDQLVSVTDPRNLATTYSYDGLSNLNSQISPDTGPTTSTYDAAGNPLTRTDAKQQQTTYAYDALNRVTSITFSDGSTQTYAYDQGPNGLGRLSTITEADPQNQVTSVIAYGHDVHGRVVAETRTINGIAYALAYAYDTAGRMTGMTYPSGRTLAYSLDALGRVTQVLSTPLGGSPQIVATNIDYEPFGGVKSYLLGNGQTYTRSFDLDGRIASYNLGSQSFSIGYDAASRISFISDTADAANTNTYSYDPLDRLTGAVLPSVPYAYAYDAVGNRTSKTVGSATDAYAYDPASNRLTGITPQTGAARSFVFDANGSTTDDGVNQYAYDTRGRMVQSTGALGVTSYQVNALGQRIRKTNSGGDRVFLYDTRGRLISEATPQGQITRDYMYLGDIPLAVTR